jgi:hypothetical protein
MMEGEMVLVGKRKADEGEGTSEGGPAGASQTLLSPKLRRLAQTVIPFHAVVELRRIEDEEAEEVTKMSVLPPNELIGLGSPVLDILMGYLDQKSLKNCRQVCKSWEDAARRALMKRCGLYVEAFFKSVRPSEQNRVELYSSWSLYYNRSIGGRKRNILQNEGVCAFQAPLLERSSRRGPPQNFGVLGEASKKTLGFFYQNSEASAKNRGFYQNFEASTVVFNQNTVASAKNCGFLIKILRSQLKKHGFF